MKPNQKIIEMIAMIGLHTNDSHFKSWVGAMFFFLAAKTQLNKS